MVFYGLEVVKHFTMQPSSEVNYVVRRQVLVWSDLDFKVLSNIIEREKKDCKSNSESWKYEKYENKKKLKPAANLQNAQV
jgi:hypothetical protein